MTRKGAKSFEYCFLLLFVIFTAFFSTIEASTKSTNKKADKIFEQYAAGEKKKGNGVYYKILDVTGDGVHELVIRTVPNSFASGARLDVYKYSSGKMVLMLSAGAYGLNKVYVYKKTKSLITEWEARGQKVYRYYQLAGDYYEELVHRYKTITDNKWVYEKDRTIITKKQFNSIVKKLKKGKKVTVKTS